MNIEDKRKEKDMIYFDRLEIGKAFQYNNDIYIKVDIDDNKCNAVDLLIGTGHFFMSGSVVVPLDAKVVIMNDVQGE